MAGDLRYAANQASSLMFFAADQVCRSSTNEAHLKTLKDFITNIREELRDSEAKRQVLFEQNCIVACEKDVSEDHVATLEGQTRRFKSQGFRKACEALGFEKGKQLGGCSTLSGESESPDPVRVTRITKEADIALSSLGEMNFTGLFRQGGLDYDSFRQFCCRPGPRGSYSDSKD
ncbi:unnamed protein product [Lactuca saligna]|uniref:Uncharacterized protein n=1 Tax=Lactuca saligna TaxID=75948 RepID=A0AA35Z7V4_LACSI|nr:unnamed protein product [Lactuca saligna]